MNESRAGAEESRSGSVGESPPTGNKDVLNAATLYPSDDAAWGVPTIPAYRGSLPELLVPYGKRVRATEPLEKTRSGETGVSPEAAVHFFLDDHRFEPVWSVPSKGLSYVRKLGLALSPDFSLFPDYPPALQLFNVYRNRWCGAYWRSRGVRVIPTIAWSDESSYAFCFLGVENGSAVAVSTLGLGRGPRGATEDERRMFAAGYGAMLDALDPEAVLVLGEIPLRALGVETKGGPEIRTYPSRWSDIRAARREAKQRLAAREAEEKRKGPRE